jgi:phosphatidylinositol alpha-1,6-mannosyltransferase
VRIEAVAMTKLLILTPTLSPETGWGRYSDAIVRNLERQYELDVCTELPDIMELRSSFKALYYAVQRVRGRVESADSVLSLVSYPYSLVAYLATRGTDVPYFVTCHGTYAVEPLFNKHRVPARHSFSQSAALFAVSSFTADRMRERMSACNIYIIPNGVTDERPELKPFDLDNEVLLTVGAFKPRKGQLRAVEAFAQVASQLPDVDHHFVGDVSGEYAEAVQDHVEELGLKDRVHFEGRVPEEELGRWYNTADAFLLTPRYEQHHFEGFGLVYLEANRHGVPVIGTYGTGAEDAIAPGVSGFCVPPEDDAIAEAVHRLFDDNDLYRRVSEGAERWADCHSWLRTTVEMTKVSVRKLREKSTDERW